MTDNRNPSSTPPPISEARLHASVLDLHGRLINLPRRNNGGALDRQIEQIVDKLYELERVALAARSNQEATPDAETRALNMQLLLDTAIKHKLETQTHGGLTEFGKGGLASLESLKREFDQLTTKPVQEATRTVEDAELDRVAQAIYQSHARYHGFPGERWNDEPAVSKMSWRNTARAAIDALSHTSSCGPDSGQD